MSVDSLLDSAFTTLLGKAFRDLENAALTPAAASAVRTVNVALTFSGGGFPLPLAGGLPGLFEIPYPLTLVWVHIYAGDETGAPMLVTSASVDLRLTSITSFGSSTPIYGATMPSLAVASAALVDTTDWISNFITGDTILYRLDSFVGTATWLTLTMQFRPTDVPLGVSTVIDSGGDTLIDSSGNTLVLRN